MIIDQWSNQVVTLHNQFRAQYGAPPVTWSQSRYNGAQAYANECVFQHRYEQPLMYRHKGDRLFYSDSGGQYGENLVGYLLFSKIRR